MRPPSVPWYVAYEAIRLYSAMLKEAHTSAILAVENEKNVEVIEHQYDYTVSLQEQIYKIGPIVGTIDLSNLPPPYAGCLDEKEVRKASRTFQQMLIEGHDLPLSELLVHSFG